MANANVKNTGTAKGADALADGVKKDAKDSVSAAQEKASEIAQDAVRFASDAYEAARDEAEARLAEAHRIAGSAAEDVSDRVRHAAEATRETSREAVDRIAHRASEVTETLRNSEAGRIVGDVGDYARERPFVTMGLAALAGFTIARLTAPRHDDRYGRRS